MNSDLETRPTENNESNEILELAPEQLAEIAGGLTYNQISYGY